MDINEKRIRLGATYSSKEDVSEFTKIQDVSEVAKIEDVSEFAKNETTANLRMFVIQFNIISF